MGKKSKLSAAQKREVVLKMIRREEPATALARRYGVSEQSLYRWRDEFLEGGQAALANGQGGNDAQHRRLSELERELAERDRVIGELILPRRRKSTHKAWLL